MKLGFKSFRKLAGYFWQRVANLPMSGTWRWRFLRLSGIKFNVPKDGKHFVYIGNGVTWDSAYPEEIEIGNYVHVTTGCVLLTHHLDTSRKGIYWKKGHIKIEDGVFLGAHTVISKSVTIGKGSIVGAGSVVTKNIPSYEIGGGVPAKFIKKIENND